MSIIPSVIDRIVTQQSQLLSQFSQHAIHNELHLPLTLPSPHRGEGWGEGVERLNVLSNDGFQILFRLFRDEFFASNKSGF
jgi:hypothetical protein